MPRKKKPTASAESTSMPISPAPVPTPSYTGNEFSLGLHLQKAWVLFKSIWKQVLALQAAGCAFGCLFSAVALFIAGILITLGGLSLSQVLGFDKGFGTLPTPAFPIAIGILLGVLIFVYLIGMIVSTIVLQNATLYAFFNAHALPTFGQSIRKGLQTTWKAFLFSFLAMFLVFGGFWLFALPGMIIGFFLCFGLYAIVNENKGPIAAIRRSYELIRTDPWLALGHVLILSLIFMGIGFFVNMGIQLISLLVSIPFMSFGNHSDSLAGMIILPIYLIPTIVNVALGWYGLAYYVVLYRYLSQKFDNQGRKTYRTLWMWIVALVGWIFFALVMTLFGYAIVKLAAQSGKNDQKKEQQQNPSSSVTSKYSVPSNCGLEISMPNTMEKDTNRKWIYEERMLDPSALWNFPTAKEKQAGVLAGYVQFKKDADRFQPNTKVFPRRDGFIVHCTENPDNLTLEAVLKRITTDKTYKTELSGASVMAGSLLTQPIRVEGLKKGDFYSEPFYVGISADKNRIIYIQIWIPSTDDGEESVVLKETYDTFHSLKDRAVDKKFPASVTGKPVSTTSTGGTAQKTNTSCTRYKIYEGSFKSDKCYTASDYKDLTYYMNKYNSAVFQYNGAISSMRITCNGSEFFKDECKEDKEQKSDAEHDMNDATAKIKAIIARGT